MSVHAEPPPPVVVEPHGIKYATGDQLGKGGFAICHRAEMLEREKSTGHMVALKIVKTKMEPAKLAQKFVTELQIHSKLAHPNIVAFHRAFSFEANTYVVLELCSSGSLADLLKRRKNLTMPEIRRFIIQVSGAVKYLHARNIVHRDLKTGNLFLDEHMNVKVGDFGLAALLVSGKEMDAKRRTTMCGTPNYLAPEILEKGKGHNEKVDLWAIGIISYTLAVGKAPFHAASKEEIYKKLKAGDYSWPELSSITNEISADLRDLVASLLVTEELRPCPDKIVAHPFFKIAFVPTRMSRSQITKAPQWNIPVPGPEVLQRGYSDSWWQVCKESGVGEYAPGKCFALNAGKRIRSVVKDIEREVAAGRQPVIPIPADTVYTPFPYSGSWAANPGVALTEIAEEKESSGEVGGLREIPHNEVQLVVPKTREAPLEAAARKRKDAEMMPPPGRMRRDGTVRKPRVPSRDRAENEENIPERQDQAEVSRPSSKASSRPTGSRTTIRSKPTLSEAEDPESKSMERARSVRRAADASLARRPRTMRKVVSEEAPSVPETELPQMPARAALPPQRTLRTRAKQAAQEVIEIFDDEEVPGQNQPLVLPPAPAMPAKVPVPTTRRRQEVSSAVSGTDPSSVLERLSSFRDNLICALQKKYQAPSRSTPKQPSQPLPFVSRWVDYSRKYGVGYVLDDGTVGCIINAYATKSTPATHVVVRNGEKWLRTIGKKFENLDQVPFCIFEDRGEKGIHRVNLKARTVDDKTRERQHMLKVLWVKFGRYMAQREGLSDEGKEYTEDESKEGDFLFVRFYQRMGNVGIWGFSDGCLQLHFPDHTKLVFSADGVHVSATLVSVEGVAAIEANNDLPMRMLRDREVLAYPIHSLLYATKSRDRHSTVAEMVSANMFEEKMKFLREILEQWLEGGGLGRGSDDERLQWNGLWVNEHARKIDWVTVGRYGGDETQA